MTSRAEDVVVRAREAGGYAVLELFGELTVSGGTVVRRELTKLLLDRGQVLVDVSRLRLGWTPALAVFPAALAEAGGWPLARLVLVGADPELSGALHAARVPQSVPLAATWERAERALGIRPGRLRREVVLPAAVDAVVLARAAAAHTCADWELAALAEVAKVVASELVSNAVRHAGTASRLAFTRTEAGLHISVRDWARIGEAEPPRWFGEPAAGHYGLSLVAALTRHTGVTRHPDGKTVWAVLAAPEPR